MNIVKGWCPGALRPMETGDGLLVRLRLTGGIVTSEVALAIADCATRFGSGLIELTARANLQLRGISQHTLAPLLDRLTALRLLDADARTESVRNVIASPLAGLDPAARIDIGPIVAALENRLTSDPALGTLPGKFGFIVEDGGSFDLSSIGADVRFSANGSSGTPGFILAIAGAPGGTHPIGRCAPDEVANVAAAIAAAFLHLRGLAPTAPRRMHHLVGKIGVDAIVRAANLGRRDPMLQTRVGLKQYESAATCLGYHKIGATGFIGIATPFGRWNAQAFRLLATAARTHASGQLRLTPWRVVLIPGVDPASCESLVASLVDNECIAEASDPRLAVAACPGAPACASGTTPTQDDALGWANIAHVLSPSGIGLHVSGCAKGCVRPEKTRATLVASAGRYNLIVDGRAGDPAVLKNLTRGDATLALTELMRDTPVFEASE